MKMIKSDAKSLIAQAKKKSNKSKVSFTFNEELYEEFKSVCEKNEVAVSRMIEVLITDFLTDAKNKK